MRPLTLTIALIFLANLLSTAIVQRAWRLPARLWLPSAILPPLALLLLAVLGLERLGMFTVRRGPGDTGDRES